MNEKHYFFAKFITSLTHKSTGSLSIQTRAL